jgi:flagellar basal-body rod modification protein FlgD
MSTVSTVNTTAGQSAASFLNPTTEIRTTGKQALGVNDFLKLITVQLANQDPLKPMEDTQFISQMASFTSLEQMQTLSKDFASFTAQQKATGAQDLLGRNVTVSSEAGDVTGLVSKITYSDGQALLSINGQDYDAAGITSVSNGAAAPITPSQPTNSTTN